ncbi:hypothetical protein [Paenibacillus polymyxa]|uniref:hypothetical protein n=1 Tax=Paenibacillus polymyxa TaxID=1406 RepID=UPI0021E3C556|nr:hypothetical protein [Paenibacillus polymyxa]
MKSNAYSRAWRDLRREGISFEVENVAPELMYKLSGGEIRNDGIMDAEKVRRELLGEWYNSKPPDSPQ